MSNENKNNGFDSSSDIEHIKDIERMLEQRSSQSNAGAPERRRYLRNVPKPEPKDNDTIMIEKVAPEGKVNTSISKPTVSQYGNIAETVEKADGRTDKVPESKIAELSDANPNATRTIPAVKAQKPKLPAEPTVVSSRHSVVETKKTEDVYVPLMTEHDDFEIDENPEPDEVAVKGTMSALTSVAKAIIYMIAVLGASIFLAVTFISMANDVFAFVKDDAEVTIVIPENCSTEQLAEILGESGAIKYPFIFKLYADFKELSIERTEKDDIYVAGTYNISPMLNYDYMIYEFKPKAPPRTQVTVTIPEGYSVDQVVRLLVEKGLGTYEGYIRAINEYDGYEYRFLDELEMSEHRFWRLEGYLYPDTYYYFSDATEETVIYKMLENFNNKFTEEYYDHAEEMGMTVDEIITLASMIQKEVKYADEFGNVSSVFHNRLNNPANFPYLDSDATIIYAIERDTGERPQTLKETTYESPYNTYKNKGLPPGPIANPSMEAIRYAMYPNKTSYYFFFTGNNGRTTFSRTYADHLKVIEENK